MVYPPRHADPVLVRCPLPKTTGAALGEYVIRNQTGPAGLKSVGRAPGYSRPATFGVQMRELSLLPYPVPSALATGPNP
jgi:hypothetical protein